MLSGRWNKARKMLPLEGHKPLITCNSTSNFRFSSSWMYSKYCVLCSVFIQFYFGLSVLSSPSSPMGIHGACFSKVLVTFRAWNQIIKSKSFVLTNKSFLCLIKCYFYHVLSRSWISATAFSGPVKYGLSRHESLGGKTFTAVYTGARHDQLYTAN